MDPAAKQATRDRIAALRAAGTTILLTTHELGDVERLADHVAVLDRGRIVAYGTPAELTGAGAPRVRFRLSAPLADPEPRAPLAASSRPPTGPRSSRPAPAPHYELEAWPRRRIRGSSRRSPPGAQSAGLLITELRLGAASLEERYLELVGEDVAAEAEGTA